MLVTFKDIRLNYNYNFNYLTDKNVTTSLNTAQTKGHVKVSAFDGVMWILYNPTDTSEARKPYKRIGGGGCRAEDD